MDERAGQNQVKRERKSSRQVEGHGGGPDSRRRLIYLRNR